MWRADDEALLARIEDELSLEALWAEALPPGVPLPHPRASGLFAALRQSARGRDELAAARRRGSLGDLIRRDDHRGLSPAALHHLAVLQARVASALAAARPDDRRAQSDAELSSLAAWIALVGEGQYLSSLARAVDPEAPADGGMRWLGQRLSALGARARAGAMELDGDSHAAMRVLARVAEACRHSGCSVALQKQIEALAERERAQVVEAALAPISAALADAQARGAIERDGRGLMERIVAVWNWSDWDEHVERYAIDEATPLAWNVYQLETGFDQLRRLISPLEPLVDNLARRVEGDLQRLAYAAPVAQMYVFRSEMAVTLEDQLCWAERSVAVCPTHRNGRLILARLLCWDVRGRLDQGISANLAKDTLVANLDRAETLFPQTEGIEELRARIDRLRWWRPG